MITNSLRSQYDAAVAAKQYATAALIADASQDFVTADYWWRQAESLIADEYRIPQTQPEQATMPTPPKIRFDADGRPCQLAYTPAGETRWTPSKDGVLIEFCGKGCTVKSAAQLIGWSDVAKRANDNPDFAAPWFACLGYQYADFAAHWESRGYDFPCTSEQFRARVAEYAGDNQSLAEVLINQGGAT